jgi:hypothetical protein
MEAGLSVAARALNRRCQSVWHVDPGTSMLPVRLQWHQSVKKIQVGWPVRTYPQPKCCSTRYQSLCIDPDHILYHDRTCYDFKNLWFTIELVFMLLLLLWFLYKWIAPGSQTCPEFSHKSWFLNLKSYQVTSCRFKLSSIHLKWHINVVRVACVASWDQFRCDNHYRKLVNLQWPKSS